MGAANLRFSAVRRLECAKLPGELQELLSIFLLSQGLAQVFLQISHILDAYAEAY